jgi:hypothetical protein
VLVSKNHIIGNMCEYLVEFCNVICSICILIKNNFKDMFPILKDLVGISGQGSKVQVNSEIFGV